MSLVEVVVSAAIVGVISMALGSAVLIATKAMDLGGGVRDTDGGAAVEMPAPSAVVQQITADLAVATGFSQRAATAVAFTVPDRDGDGNVEALSYEWSGTPGDSLIYTHNGHDVVLASNVQQLDLAFLSRTVSAPQAMAKEVESAERLLASHGSSDGSLKDRQVEPDKMCATYVRPALPANAVSWKITRITFMLAKKAEEQGEWGVQIRTDSGGLRPSAVILGSVSLNGASVPPDWTDVTVAFASPVSLDAASGVCLVIHQTSQVGKAGFVRWEENGANTPDAHYLESGDGGATWTSPGHSRDMIFSLFGTVTTKGPPEW